jgi:hypothetical protein
MVGWEGAASGVAAGGRAGPAPRPGVRRWPGRRGRLADRFGVVLAGRLGWQLRWFRRNRLRFGNLPVPVLGLRRSGLGLRRCGLGLRRCGLSLAGSRVPQVCPAFVIVRLAAGLHGRKYPAQR